MSKILKATASVHKHSKHEVYLETIVGLVKVEEPLLDLDGKKKDPKKTDIGFFNLRHTRLKTGSRT